MTSSLHDPFFSRTCSILATALVTLTATTALALMAGGSGELLRLSAEPILKEALPQWDG